MNPSKYVPVKLSPAVAMYDNAPLPTLALLFVIVASAIPLTYKAIVPEFLEIARCVHLFAAMALVLRNAGG